MHDGNSLRERARSYFETEMSPAHDWHHVQRVETIAEELLAAHPDADARVLFPAVVLHDIGRAREDRGEIDDHACWGAREAKAILQAEGFDGDSIDAVCHAISTHRYSSDPEPETIEAKLLCDADNLDALGAVGVARTFTYGGELGQPMYDPDLPPDADGTLAGETQYNHLHKKILQLPERMYTDAGRELAETRRGFVEEFLDRFDAEIAGRQ